MIKRNFKDVFRQATWHFKGDSGGGGSTTTIQKADPWAGQQPYLLEGFAAAKNQFLNPSSAPTYFKGSTVADFSPDTYSAMSQIRQQAGQGSAVNTNAQQMIGDTLGGKYLYGGDAFNAALDASRRSIMPTVDSAYAKAGRYGSGLAQTAQTQVLGDAFANQYGQERNNQMQAANMAPQISDLRFADAKALGGIGETQYGQDQAKLSDEVARHNFEQNIQADQLSKYMNLIQGNYGSQQTSTQSGGGASGGSKTAGALGGALQGAAMGSAGGPMGAMIGGGLGLLGGLF